MEKSKDSTGPQTIRLPDLFRERQAILRALRLDKTLRVGSWSIRCEEQAGDDSYAYVLRSAGQYFREFDSADAAADYLLTFWRGFTVEVLG